MFVLNVDLWNEDGTREVNLVRHSSGTPSISSTTPASYASLTTSTPAFANILPSHRAESPYPGPDMGYGQAVMGSYGMSGYGGAPSPYGQAPPSAYPQCKFPSECKTLDQRLNMFLIQPSTDLQHTRLGHSTTLEAETIVAASAVWYRQMRE